MKPGEQNEPVAGDGGDAADARGAIDGRSASAASEPTDQHAPLEATCPGGERNPADCRMVSETLARIGDKWTVLVVEQLCATRGPTRFNEIRRSIDGISQRMLTLTLRGLERDGLVTRTVHPTVPPRVEYALTDLGRTLRTPLVAVAEWARANRPAINEARKIFDATSDASPSSRQIRRRGPALLQRATRAPGSEHG